MLYRTIYIHKASCVSWLCQTVCWCMLKFLLRYSIFMSVPVEASSVIFMWSWHVLRMGPASYFPCIFPHYHEQKSSISVFCLQNLRIPPKTNWIYLNFLGFKHWPPVVKKKCGFATFGIFSFSHGLKLFQNSGTQKPLIVSLAASLRRSIGVPSWRPFAWKCVPLGTNISIHIPPIKKTNHFPSYL